ncbi:hypothetical protein ABGB12_31595 [Actinocorallia sp. B10E7]|uniref:hypothetical protein n=1 Tax=Actinocorallia sp. B10E7 TaxID=3153558 RepID=UPI00325EC5D7
MSRTPMRPHPEVARATGVVLFGGVLLTQSLGLPRGFELESYLGVIMIFSSVLAWAGAVGLLAENGSPVWWYTLAYGIGTIFSWLFTQLFGLPVLHSPVEGHWLDRHGLILLFFSVNLALLSTWVLRSRQVSAGSPVASAADRIRRRSRYMG